MQVVAVDLVVGDVEPSSWDSPGRGWTGPHARASRAEVALVVLCAGGAKVIEDANL
jgi:hypothetical protein